MKRKNMIAIVAGLGFVAAMVALSQVRYFKCSDIKRVENEFAQKLEPLITKIESLDDSGACKMAQEEVSPLMENYEKDLMWFSQYCFGEKNNADSIDRFRKFDPQIRETLKECASIEK
jgi:hypothetical protein